MNYKSSGFTLIELLVVISIIAILVGLSTVSFSNAQKKARDNKRKADLKTVQQALEYYNQVNGKYPSTIAGSLRIQCNVPGDATAKTWGSKFSCTPTGSGEIIYMDPLPKEAVNSATTPYRYATPVTGVTGPTYMLGATLENTDDPDINTATCDITASNFNINYCVFNP